MFDLTPAEIEALTLSLRVSLWAVFWSLPAGIAVAWLLARRSFPGKVIFDVLVHLPLVVPPVVVGYLLLVLMGRRGVIGAWLLHRRWVPWVLCLVASVSMGVFAPVVYADGLPDGLRFAAAMSFSLVGGLIPSSLFAAAARLAPSPDLIGATNGLLMQGSNTGQMLGPPALAALVAWAGGWQVAPWLLCFFAFVTAGLSLRLRMLERKEG